MLVQKTPPQVGDAQMNRVVQQIYRDLNEIIAAMPSTSSTLPQPSASAEGSIRVTKQEGTVTDNEGNSVYKTGYVVSIRTKDGWVDSAGNIFTERADTDR